MNTYTLIFSLRVAPNGILMERGAELLMQAIRNRVNADMMSVGNELIYAIDYNYSC